MKKSVRKLSVKTTEVYFNIFEKLSDKKLGNYTFLAGI